MKKFTVEIYAVDWCGFSEHYEVEAENENFALDIAMEKHETDFVDMFSLELTDDGYIESEDIDGDDYDEDDTSTLSTRIIY